MPTCRISGALMQMQLSQDGYTWGYMIGSTTSHLRDGPPSGPFLDEKGGRDIYGSLLPMRILTLNPQEKARIHP